MAKHKRQIVFPREVLLVEIERRCADERCNAKNRIGLTKEDARTYRGFACVRCERRHEDVLTERDVPDWWEELAVTGLVGLRPPAAHGTAAEVDVDGASGVVARLSAAWRGREATTAHESADADARTSEQ